MSAETYWTSFAVVRSASSVVQILWIPIEEILRPFSPSRKCLYRMKSQ